MSVYEPLQGLSAFDLNHGDQQWLVFYKNSIVLPESGYFWSQQDWFNTSEAFVSGYLDGKPVAVISVAHFPEDCELMDPREFLALEEPGYTFLYSHGIQLLTARKNHRFCGSCGSECSMKDGEWAMVCTACEMRFYPRISPCIIVLVHKGDEVLLVQHHRHLRHTQVYTTIAGFIEPGESAEEAVVREVEEEAGIKVNNVRYCFSQSWPFPHSLMLGYHADYVSGEIELEEKELADGQWFHKDNLPEIPPTFTIARRLIDLGSSAATKD